MARTELSTGARMSRIWAKRQTVALLVRRDLKVRYANSVLGYLWTVLDPLLMGMTYWFVFGVLFPRNVGHLPYVVFLLAALLPWQWFTNAVNEGSQAFKRDGALIRSTNLPREIWVLRVVVSKCVEFLFSIPVLAAFVLAYVLFLDPQQIHLNWHLVLFPVGVVLQFLLLLGMSLILAPLVVLLQDIEPLVRIWLRWMMYASPVIYSTDLVTGNHRLPEWVKDLFLLNPLTGILAMYRAGIFPAAMEPSAILISVVEIIALLVLGLWVFRRLEPTVLKEL